MPKQLICLILAAVAGAAEPASLKLPAIFGDHMVLQQGLRLPVWGWAAPGEAVTVAFAGQSAATTADAAGHWRVDLGKVAANAAPQTLTVAGATTLSFHDVVVGDVWLCSGQSNMEFQMVNGQVPGYGGGGYGGAHNATEAVASAGDPQLRLFHVKRRVAFEPVADVEGRWELCTPESVKPFSAVGYFFGRELRRVRQQPVGLISSTWGGTGCVYWASFDGLRKRADTIPEIAQWERERKQLLAELPAALAAYPGLQQTYEQDLKRWLAEVDQEPAYVQQKAAWEVAARAARAANQPLPPRPTPSRPRPSEPRDPALRHFPGNLYNGMIAPLIPYALAGAIWYQGEGEAGHTNFYHYRPWFAALIGDWRERWGQGDFPFLYVQLEGFGNDRPANELRQTADHWPGVREAQLQTLALPNTGMASAIDLGDVYNVHPQDKLDIGLRLALVARHVAYGEDLVYSGPLYKSMQIEGGSIRLTFDQVGGGLVIGAAPWLCRPENAVPTDELRGFAIAGADKHFVWAKARIDGRTVVVHSDEVPQPVAVRYGWACHPYLNLYNAERLPAPSFRTDDWLP